MFQSFLNLDMGKKLATPAFVPMKILPFQSFLNLDMGKKYYLLSIQIGLHTVSILLEFGYGEKGIRDLINLSFERRFNPS